MSDFIIATSSTADLTRDYLDAHSIPFIRYSFTVNDLPREDDCREESRAAIYAGMRRGDVLKTSMINEYSYYDFFRGLLEQRKDVIFLDMSEKRSVSFENDSRAAETIRKEYPEQRLYLMDTRCISGGLGLLVKMMIRRMEAGESFEQVLAWGEENKLKMAHRFTVDDLNYLKRGGRVSNASALVGSLLNIKPVLYVPDAGTLDVVKKARGRKAALKSIVDGVLHDLSEIDPTGTEFLILHADCLADAEHVRDEIRKAYPQVGEIAISSLGVVIGAHCGPGLLTVFYLCGGRRPE
ncbi:MAG: DegV family protein [Oscillospiraceae bacterium]|nr:DegV family protein [Oscillospiraceae bacterium]